ncbi:MAG: hypothetical protein KUG77_13360 [Nannocystaceae bacterium]|nr:hypothetical protein [Nannocystaceae bacterium]
MGPSTTYAGVVRQLAPACLGGALFLGCLAESPDPVRFQGDSALVLLGAVEADGYQAWESPPTSAELPRRREASGAHGPWVEVYLHPALLAAFFSEDGLDAWPEGVAAVCESYESEDAPDPFLIQVMRKDDNGWLWAQVDAGREPLTQERPDDCIGCHGGGEDFVFSVFLPRG